MYWLARSKVNLKNYVDEPLEVVAWIALSKKIGLDTSFFGN